MKYRVLEYIGYADPSSKTISSATITTGVQALHVSVQDAVDLSVNNQDGSGNGISSFAPGLSGVRCIDTNQRAASVTDSTETIWTNGTITTTSTSPNQVVATYTVPAGKSFFLLGWQAYKTSANSVDATPFRLRIGSTDHAAVSITVSDIQWTPPLFPAAIFFADSEEIVTLTVTPSAATSTSWHAAIIGVIR